MESAAGFPFSCEWLCAMGLTDLAGFFLHHWDEILLQVKKSYLKQCWCSILIFHILLCTLKEFVDNTKQRGKDYTFEGMPLSFSWALCLSCCHMVWSIPAFWFVSAVLVLKLCAFMFLLSLFLMQSCPKYNTPYICISSVLLLEGISCSRNPFFFPCTKMLIFSLTVHTQ